MGCFLLVVLSFGLLLLPCAMLLPLIHMRCRKAAHPAHCQEVARVVEWCAEHAAQFGADPAKVVAVGESSGGQLAVLLAAGSVPCGKKLSGVITVSAPFDIRREALARLHSIVRHSVERLIIREPFGLDSSGWAKASPLHHLESGHFPKEVPLLVSYPQSEFFGIKCIENQFAPILCPSLACEVARKQGVTVFEEVLDSRLHVAAVAQLRPVWRRDHAFWSAVDECARQ